MFPRKNYNIVTQMLKSMQRGNAPTQNSNHFTQSNSQKAINSDIRDPYNKWGVQQNTRNNWELNNSNSNSNIREYGNSEMRDTRVRNDGMDPRHSMNGESRTRDYWESRDYRYNNNNNNNNNNYASNYNNNNYNNNLYNNNNSNNNSNWHASPPSDSTYNRSVDRNIRERDREPTGYKESDTGRGWDRSRDNGWGRGNDRERDRLKERDVDRDIPKKGDREIRERSRERDWDKDKSRGRDREISRERDWDDKNRGRNRERSRDRSRERDSAKPYYNERDRRGEREERERDWDRDRNRTRERGRDERDRDRDRDLYREYKPKDRDVNYRGDGQGYNYRQYNYDGPNVNNSNYPYYQPQFSQHSFPYPQNGFPFNQNYPNSFPNTFPSSYPSNLLHSFVPQNFGRMQDQSFGLPYPVHGCAPPRSRIFGEVLTNSIPEAVKNRYKAAGVLLYSFDTKGTMYLLLGCENRAQKKKYRTLGQDMSCVWLHFGGKKETEEIDPAITAARELDEETGGLFKSEMEEISHQLRQPDISKLWFPGGKYVLYFLETKYDTTISSRFAAVDPATRENMDQTRMEWVPCSELSQAVSKRTSLFSLERDGNVETQHFLGFFMEMMSVPDVMPHLEALKTKTL